MDGYIDEILKEYQEISTIHEYIVPAEASLFDHDDKTEKMKDSSFFHRMVAKLLYLSKRARPDILLAVQYLTTRVKSPTKTDEKKLARVIGYLKATKEKSRTVSSKAFDRVGVYIDAAFGCHMDGKSHSAAVITLGDTPIMTISRKQKIVTRDSTEAELVALSDLILMGEWLHEYLRESGIKLKKPVVYQDNTSTIALVKDLSVGKMRSKHFRARRAVVYQELMIFKTMEIQYINTKEMVADLLTKPLTGDIFHRLAKKILKGI